MKKKLVIFALTVMVLGLTACGNKKEEPETVEMADTYESALETSTPSPKEETVPYSDITGNNTITVNSSEKVSVVPDIAEVVYAVRTQEQTAAACQEKNGEAVNSVITLLKELGVEETSIQTSDYYMNPVYNYSGNTTRVTGYEAVTSLTVSDLPIDNLDEILSQSVLSGINTVRSITYQASQYDKSYQEALTKAVSVAYEKAQVLAAASGATVGKVISIQEVSGYSPARYTDYARTGMANSYSAEKEEALADTAAVMPGEIQVEAALIVEYQLVN